MGTITFLSGTPGPLGTPSPESLQRSSVETNRDDLEEVSQRIPSGNISHLGIWH